MTADAAPALEEGRATPFPTLTLANGLSVSSAGFSARGARQRNEDRLGIASDPGTGFWALADGLGGHEGGARAAELAVEAGLNSLQRSAAPRLEDKLKQAVSDAHARIRQEQKADPKLAAMRSTLVLGAVSAEELAWAHNGDSRAYHLRDGKLLWRTRDHSVVQLLIAAGELDESQAATHPDRSRLVSCLGGQSSLLISAKSAGTPPRRGDVLLLCSDGFWEHFDKPSLEATVAAAATPEALLDALGAKVAAAGRPTQDNYTAIAVYLGG